MFKPSEFPVKQFSHSCAQKQQKRKKVGIIYLELFQTNDDFLGIEMDYFQN